MRSKSVPERMHTNLLGNPSCFTGLFDCPLHATLGITTIKMPAMPWVVRWRDTFWLFGCNVGLSPRIKCFDKERSGLFLPFPCTTLSCSRSKSRYKRTLRTSIQRKPQHHNKPMSILCLRSWQCWSNHKLLSTVGSFLSCFIDCKCRYS
jgi:hypothetical protein